MPKLSPERWRRGSLPAMAAIAVAVFALGGLPMRPAAAQPAERDFCRPGTRHAIGRGAAMDFDVRDADVHDVYRMISDVGRVNVVISDKVRARVTMRLKRVPWDRVACTVAAVHKLRITVDGSILLVRPAEP